MSERQCRECRQSKPIGEFPLAKRGTVRGWVCVPCWGLAKAEFDARLHDAHVKQWWADDAARYRWRYRHDAEFNLRERLRRQFRKKRAAVVGVPEAIQCAMRNGGRSPKIERLLGYSIADLRAHLERQFTNGMDWTKWGRNGIHIDHISPAKCFDLSKVDGIMAYWSLSNLRPLWAQENLKKSDRVTLLI